MVYYPKQQRQSQVLPSETSFTSDRATRSHYMNINHYTYRVTWSSDDNEHVGLCAEFPSLSWLAPSPEKALAGIRKVVADVVEEMTASEESCPV